jgi:putative heme-binding domain-containing protein
MPSLQCTNCHRIDRTGGDLGPDLTHIGKTYPRHELLEALVDPSKKIDPKFATHLIITKNGKVFTGIVIENTKKQVTLNVLKDGKAEQIRIPAGEIEELVVQKKSLMPDQLLRDLTPQQAADLLEFLAMRK